MAIRPYTVKTHDGKTVTFEAPEDAPREQLTTLAARALKAKYPDALYRRPILDTDLLKKQQGPDLSPEAQGSISTYNPTLTDKIGDKISSALEAFGVGDRYARHVGERTTSALADLTPVGAAVESSAAREALDQGRILPALGHGALAALSAVPEVGTGAKAMFLGVMAKNADRAALVKAKGLLKSGADRKQIWNETGWFQGADDKWRFEVPDDALKITDPKTPQQAANAAAKAKAKELGYKSPNEVPWTKFDDNESIRKAGTAGYNSVLNGVPAEQAVTHPALFEAYPERMGALTVRANTDKSLNGSFMPEMNQIRWSTRGRTPAEKRSTAAHELQHVVQNTEGFASGSRAGAAGAVEEGPYYYSAVTHRDQIRRMLDDPNVSDVSKIQLRRMLPAAEKKVNEAAQYEGYRRVAGEVEARNVQTRLGMTPEERAATPPWETEDVPRDDQFVLWFGGGAADAAAPNKAPAVIGNDPAQDILKAASEGGQSFADWRRANEGKIGTMFDYSGLNSVPDVPQVPMERYQAPRGPSERIVSALGDPNVVEGINSTVQRGVESGAGVPWYNTEPLRLAGEAVGVGPEQYGRLMDVVAATSPRSVVADNVRTGSYYNYLRESGLPIPDKPAKGYGSVAQGLHVQNVRNLDANGGWNIFQNPKPASFASNLSGNQFNATIDTHNFRLPGVLSGDPRFLETSVQELAPSREAAERALRKHYPNLPEEVIAQSIKPKGDKVVVTYRPQQWHEKGWLSMDAAKADPSLWAAKPNANEYGYYEDWQREQAAKMGITPAQYQASMWVGGAAETGLASLPEPFLKTVEARIRYTADRMGLDPAIVRDRFLKGAAPLLGIGGAAVMLKDGQLVEVDGDGTSRAGA